MRNVGERPLSGFSTNPNDFRFILVADISGLSGKWSHFLMGFMILLEILALIAGFVVATLTIRVTTKVSCNKQCF